MSVSESTVQAVSKGVGAVSFGGAVSSGWWMAFPWADVAIIMSCVGALFFMLERFFTMRIRHFEFKKAQRDDE